MQESVVFCDRKRENLYVAFLVRTDIIVLMKVVHRITGKRMRYDVRFIEE